jgi:hypothetical protein
MDVGTLALRKLKTKTSQDFQYSLPHTKIPALTTEQKNYQLLSLHTKRSQRNANSISVTDIFMFKTHNLFKRTNTQIYTC